LNHGDLAECNALARPPLRRLRAEADVNHLTIPPKSSKNDPNVWSGRALQEFRRAGGERSCINVSGLWLEHCSGPSWISARVRPH